MFKIDKVRLFALPILSGILIGTSYIPFPPWASLFCFVPLWIFWNRQISLKSVVKGGWITGFVLTLVGFNWMTYLFHEFARMPWPVAVIAMLGFAALASLFVPIAGLLWFWTKGKFNWSPRISLIMMGLFTILCEFLSWTLFDWNFGYPWFSAGLPIYHLAEWIGFSGLSMMTIAANIPIYFAWQQREQKKGKVYLALVAVGFIALNLVGHQIKQQLAKPNAQINALMVQANIGNLEKQMVEHGRGRFRKSILDRYLNLTKKGLEEYAEKGIDFAMWPETAFPDLMGENFKFRQHQTTLRRFLYDNQLSLITGAYSLHSKTGLTTNSLFLLNRDGELTSPHYSKTILLAFGEFIPGEKIFPQIRSWLPPTGNFEPGPGPTVLLKYNDVKIGPQICYESLFPQFTKGLSDLGAEIIVNATNDSWYGTWQEPYQHMYMTLARAVEYRRPLLRVTNTGITTGVLASGEILARSPMKKPWYGLFEVPYVKNPKPTFYQRWFWLMPSLLFCSILIMLGVGARVQTQSH